MAAIIRVEWNFDAGGSGVSTHVIDEGVTVSETALEAALVAVEDFWEDLDGNMIGCTGQVSNTIDFVDPNTGTLTGEFISTNARAALQGQGTGAYPAGVGARIRWRTPGIRNGRRVTGTTFVVPIVASQYDTSGTLNNLFVAALQTSGQTLVNALDANGTPMMVWSRPPSATAGNGFVTEVNGVSVPDKTAWLRSRKG